MTSDWDSATNSSRDRTFGFNVLPTTNWSTCFSDMFAEEESVVPSNDPHTTYTGPGFVQSSSERLASSICQYNSLLSKHSDVEFRSSTFAGTNYEPLNGEFKDPKDSSMVRVQLHVLVES